ncbi:hypothetical protein LTS10_010705 [Elasticomyces elasticus]|nr:hypothetical protein LTS10_010705 [Elasticomyces elasticus]
MAQPIDLDAQLALVACRLLAGDAAIISPYGFDYVRQHHRIDVFLNPVGHDKDGGIFKTFVIGELLPHIEDVRLWDGDDLDLLHAKLEELLPPATPWEIAECSRTVECLKHGQIYNMKFVVGPGSVTVRFTLTAQTESTHGLVLASEVASLATKAQPEVLKIELADVSIATRVQWLIAGFHAVRALLPQVPGVTGCDCEFDGQDDQATVSVSPRFRPAADARSLTFTYYKLEMMSEQLGATWRNSTSYPFLMEKALTQIMTEESTTGTRVLFSAHGYRYSRRIPDDGTTGGRSVVTIIIEQHKAASLANISNDHASLFAQLIDSTSVTSGRGVSSLPPSSSTPLESKKTLNTSNAGSRTPVAKQPSASSSKTIKRGQPLAKQLSGPLPLQARTPASSSLGISGTRSSDHQDSEGDAKSKRLSENPSRRDSRVSVSDKLTGHDPTLFAIKDEPMDEDPPVRRSPTLRHPSSDTIKATADVKDFVKDPLGPEVPEHEITAGDSSDEDEEYVHYEIDEEDEYAAPLINDLAEARAFIVAGLEKARKRSREVMRGSKVDGGSVFQHSPIHTYTLSSERSAQLPLAGIERRFGRMLMTSHDEDTNSEDGAVGLVAVLQVVDFGEFFLPVYVHSHNWQSASEELLATILEKLTTQLDDRLASKGDKCSWHDIQLVALWGPDQHFRHRKNIFIHVLSPHRMSLHCNCPGHTETEQKEGFCAPRETIDDVVRFIDRFDARQPFTDNPDQPIARFVLDGLQWLRNNPSSVPPDRMEVVPSILLRWTPVFRITRFLITGPTPNLITRLTSDEKAMVAALRLLAPPLYEDQDTLAIENDDTVSITHQRGNPNNPELRLLRVDGNETWVTIREAAAVHRQLLTWHLALRVLSFSVVTQRRCIQLAQQARILP